MTALQKKQLPTLPAGFIGVGGQRLPAPLASVREARGKSLEGITLPHRRTENWKYSARYLKLDESLAPSVQTHDEPLPKADVEGYRIVIRNGVVMTAESDLPALDGVEIHAYANLDEVTAQAVAKRLDNTLDRDSTQLAALNTARFEDGLLIRLASDTKIDKPLFVQCITDAHETGSVFPRITVEAGNGASMTLIEEYLTLGGEPVFVDAVTEMNLAPNAKVTYVRLSLEDNNARHVGATGVRLQSGAVLDSHAIGFGGDLRRHDLQVRLEEDGAFARLNGIAVTQGRQHYDNHTAIDHVAPNCNSEETYRCLAADRSHAIFNGRIHIHKDAQKSFADMNNKNLLLSSKAEIDTKPELEIYADDVQCAHGATVGRLDDTALFYLLTRGVDRNDAATMLSMAFVIELVDQIPVESVRDIVNARLREFMQAAFAGAEAS